MNPPFTPFRLSMGTQSNTWYPLKLGLDYKPYDLAEEAEGIWVSP